MSPSPFLQTPGKQRFGNYDIEWLPMLKSPCYGFNGPNACYSPSCKHNPLLLKSSTTTPRPSIKTTYSKQRASFQSQKSIENKNQYDFASEEYCFEYDSVPKSSTLYSDDLHDHELLMDSVYADETDMNNENYWQPKSSKLIGSQSMYIAYDNFTNIGRYSNTDGWTPKYSYGCKEKYWNLRVREENKSIVESPNTVTQTKTKHEFNPLSKPFQPAEKSGNETFFFCF